MGRLDPPFRLAKFEGDAGFLFVEDGRAAGSLLVDAIEACYLAFRRRLRSIDAATSCDCASCRLAPRLDLKVFVHHGSYVHSRIAGRDELAGSDVILAHRLLKGTVAAEARTAGFALFTAAAVEALGLDPAALGMSAGEESIEHLGRVSTFVWDLEARWQAESGQRRLDGSEGEVVLDVDMAFADRAVGGLGPPDDPGPPEPVGGPARHRGVVRRRAARCRDHHPVRDGPPRDASRRSSTGSHTTTSAGASRSPTSGRSQATVDLDPVEGGTRVHLRWTVDGPGPADAGTFAADRAREARGAETTRAVARRGGGHDRGTGGRDMIRYSSEVTIARPPHAVYEALLDPGLYPKWTDMVDVSFDGAGHAPGRDARAVPPREGPHQGDAGDGAHRARPRPTGRVPGHPPEPRLDGGLDARGCGDRDSPDLRRASSGCTAGDGCSSRWRTRGAGRRGGRGGPAEGAPGGRTRAGRAERMRIGELARQVGVSTDTVRFYERSGWLPRAARRDNAYRDYADGGRRAPAAADRAAQARRAAR